MQNLQPKLTSTRNIKLPNPKTSAKPIGVEDLHRHFPRAERGATAHVKIRKKINSQFESSRFPRVALWKCSSHNSQRESAQPRQSRGFLMRTSWGNESCYPLVATTVSYETATLLSADASSCRLGWNQTWKHFVMNIKACFFPKSTSPNRKGGSNFAPTFRFWNLGSS